MNQEETKQETVDAPNGEPTSQPVDPPKAEPEKKEYESRVKILLERPTVKVGDLSEEAQEMIENLKMLTDDFKDFEDKRAQELDFLADKWIKDEIAGKKISPSTKQKREQLENKFKKIEEEDAKRKKEEEEKEEADAEKKRKEEESEEKRKEEAKEKEEADAEDKRKVAEKANTPERKIEAYIDNIYAEGKREITVNELRELGFDPPKEDFLIGKYELMEDLYHYEYDIIKTEEEIEE